MALTMNLSPALFVGLLYYVFAVTSCTEPADEAKSTKSPVVTKKYQEAEYQDITIPDTVLYDKILGSLVGSAIGDAMGAPTEMWSQQEIGEEYGYVSELDVVLREPSPEGPFDFNLPPGSGTDDTRWKALTVEFLVERHEGRDGSQPFFPQAKDFAETINLAYEQSVADLKATVGVEPEPFEDNMRRITWLQEWAKVSRAYSSGNIDTYRDAMSKFYGGEMACAGMLYAPAIAAAYPGRPEAAYRAAYEMGFFDVGYARDITGMTAAITAAAFADTLSIEGLRSIARDVDPAGFFRSRLLGRVSYQHFRDARKIVRQANKLTVEEARNLKLKQPDGYPYDSFTYAKTVMAYRALDEAKQSVPFHAGEVHLINLVAIMMSNFEFDQALQFVVNYGRDNDTVAAVTGAILGARIGFSALPEEQRETVLRVNKEVLEIDLEALARALTDEVLRRRPLPPAS